MSYFGKSKFIQRREAAVILAGALLFCLLFITQDFFDEFVEFAAEHEEWELDELVAVVIFAALASVVLLYRRAREMRGEIERREHAEERANELARHDPLTGLPNRRRFNEELRTALDEVANSGNECAVFLVDLDQFKAVNDLHGHAIGDSLLVEIAERLRGVCEGNMRIARLGGDEFAAVLTYPASADLAARMAGRMIRAFRKPLHVEGVRIDANATVGVARCPTDATQASDLLRAADIAMYEGKRAGRGIYRFFHAEMDVRLRERAALEAELRHALEAGQVQAYFQPVITLGDERITGFEALARWNHPTRGLIGPDIFIPIAEDLSLIDELTYRILREGCRASQKWPPYTSLSINISPSQLKASWLPARLLAVLAETGFAPGRLIVEVTENAIIDDLAQAAEVFSSLQNAGVRIALDDFGKGYSSLYHLRQLRFDHLKIDSSFVLSMDSPESEKIVRAVAGLGKSLGMPVTAEGVETEKAANALRDFGCEQAQGFLFGAPVPAAETGRFFAAQDAAPRRLRSA